MFKQFVDCRKDVNKDRLMGLFTICYCPSVRPSVCLSVTFVRPT